MSCFANELSNVISLAANGGKMSVYPLCHETPTGRLIDKYVSFLSNNLIIRVENEYRGVRNG